jgi:hypothetical protein
MMEQERRLPTIHFIKERRAATRWESQDEDEEQRKEYLHKAILFFSAMVQGSFDQ